MFAKLAVRGDIIWILLLLCPSSVFPFVHSISNDVRSARSLANRHSPLRSEACVWVVRCKSRSISTVKCATFPSVSLSELRSDDKTWIDFIMFKFLSHSTKYSRMYSPPCSHVPRSACCSPPHSAAALCPQKTKPDSGKELRERSN